MTEKVSLRTTAPVGLRRALSLRDLILFGVILIQPTAPLPIFGIIGQEAKGHVALTILLAMVAMSFTAVSYGRMATAYPGSGSAYSYVGKEIHPLLGQLAGWVMILDYVMNPVICIIWSSLAVRNIVPQIPYAASALFFTVLFTGINLQAIQTSARFNRGLAIGLGTVIAIFFVAALRYISHQSVDTASLVKPFYDPATFALPSILSGASLAALTYIGFDGVSLLAEEAENPRRNILLATVATCLITGLLSTFEVYFGQLVWPQFDQFPNVETAFSFVAGRAGGPWLFHSVNAALLIAVIGAGVAAQLGAARLMYAMGRENVLPERFFGALEGRRRVPRNNVLLVGAVALAGSFLLDYQLSCEMLNFGAFLAFMGVNIAALIRYYFRADERRLISLLSPVLGFMLCFYLWLNLSFHAKAAGALWMACGLIYALIRWRFCNAPIRTGVLDEVQGH